MKTGILIKTLCECPINYDRLNYDVLLWRHARRPDLERLNMVNCDLVMIDESCDFRSGASIYANMQEN